MTLAAIDVFGFHSQYHVLSSVGKKADEDDALVHNVSIIIGYIPLIGTIIGAARLYLSYNSNFVDYAGEDFVLALRGRAIVEICLMGYLLIIPDIIITLGRIIFDALRRVEA
jgi:hypothetical protein